MSDETSPARQIDARIADLGDWRAETLSRLRALIHAALPDIEEKVKWGGVPVWERHGIICTGETYKDKVKLTFAKGASVDDPAGLFNASLDGNARRAIDLFRESDIDPTAFQSLIVAAASLNKPKARAAKGRAVQD